MVDRQKTTKEHESNDVMHRLFSRVTANFQKYWRLIALVISVVIIAVLAYQNYNVRRESHYEAKWRALNAMPNVNPMMEGEQRMEALGEIVEESNRLITEHWRTRATPWVFLTLGNAYLELGEPESAANAYERIREDYSDHYLYLQALPNLAVALEQTDDYSAAADLYDILAEEDPLNPAWRVAAGRNREFAENRDAAIAAYEEAVERASDLEIAKNELELAEYRIAVLKRGGEFLAPPPEPSAPVVPEEVDPDEMPVPEEMPEELPVESPVDEPAPEEMPEELPDEPPVDEPAPEEMPEETPDE